MKLIEYEFSEGITNMIRLYYDGSLKRTIKRQEYEQANAYPVIRQEIEGIIFGWAIVVDFDNETARVIGPLIWSDKDRKWNMVDTDKEKMTWVIAIRKRGGEMYEE